MDLDNRGEYLVTDSWSRGNALHEFLKILKSRLLSLTLTWFCDVEESIIHFIWGMEMEFGRLRQRVFQVGKLVSHQV
jgi:hypothetical protein